MAPSAVTIVEQQYETITLNQGYSPAKAVNYDANDQHNHEIKSKTLVKDALKARVQGIDTNVCEPGEEDAFYVADLGKVYRQHMRWKQSLPRVKPHYGECKCLR